MKLMESEVSEKLEARSERARDVLKPAAQLLVYSSKLAKPSVMVLASASVTQVLSVGAGLETVAVVVVVTLWVAVTVTVETLEVHQLA